MNSNISDNEVFSVSFIKPGMNTWDKAFLENSISVLKKFQSHGSKISRERCFTEFLLELEQAYRVFLKKINDLPMIMKCRVKGDSETHFGGQECAELATSLRASAEKYLRSTRFKKSSANQNDANPHAETLGGLHIDSSNCNVYDFALIIKNMAKKDEKKAKEIEAKVYQEYVSYGKDYTLVALKNSGYTFNE